MPSAGIGDDGVVTAEATPGEPGELRPTGRPNARLRQSVTDMVRSLALVLGAVAVIMLITWRPSPDPVRVVDPTPVLIGARIEAGYPVLYPDALSPEWRPTSVRWEITEASMPAPAWHLGFVTPADTYAQIGQSATDNQSYVTSQIGNTEPADAWQGWQRYVGPDQRALLRVDDGVTVIVSGTAEWPDLEFLASRLSPTALPTVP